MNPKDILDLTIDELDDLFIGFASANEDTGTNKSKDRLEDSEALRFLIDNGGKL